MYYLSELKNSYPYSTFKYYIDPETYTREDGSDKITIDAAAVSSMVIRSSSCAFSEKEENDVAQRMNSSLYETADEFFSAYAIQWEDPEMTFALDSEGEFTYATDITLGYRINEPVTVNAFVCDGENGLSLLIDPCYMYGLPLLSEADTEYYFGEHRVSADSLFFTGNAVEGLALDTTDYAYAKVVLTDFDVTYTLSAGYSSTCTVSDISIIDTFTDITDYNISDNDAIITSADKDPSMQEVYDAIMTAKDEIFTEDTFGIILLDMDFDGTPEVLSTRIDKSNNEQGKWKCETRIYRVDIGELRYIGSLYPIYTNGQMPCTVLGLAALQDGTKAWHMTKCIEDPDSKYRDIDEDYLYTLDGYDISEYPLFTETREIIDENDPNSWDNYKHTYFYFGEPMEIEQIELTYTEEELAENWIDYPSTEYRWHDIDTVIGEGFLFGLAREDYCSRNISESFELLGDWTKYDVSPREFAHRMAYLVDEWYLGGGNISKHYYAFTGAVAKPVIYLYPEEQTDVSVKVQFPLGGELTCTYPEYGGGWDVTAMPDGTLYDGNGDEYYCLYWEAEANADLDMSKGFCIAGKDTAKFLREKLMYIGLTAREANEFIIYWLPEMQRNAYNIITLHTEEYARSIPLDVSPAPDTQIRVFMTFCASDTPVDIPAQDLPHYERSGFTLVEWGAAGPTHR